MLSSASAAASSLLLTGRSHPRRTRARGRSGHSPGPSPARDPGRARGFGVVGLDTTEEADQPIGKFNGKDLDGRGLRVEKASSGGTRGGGGGNSRGFGGC